MKPNVNCPYCRKAIDLMDLLRDSDQLAVIKMLNTFGKHSNLVLAYTELFGVLPIKSKIKKWRFLLEEMKRLFDGEAFIYQKRAYQISQAGIVEAMNIVVHRGFPDGLDSQNYLKKVMIPIAEREYQGKSRQEDKALQRKIEHLSYPVMSGGSYPIPEEKVEPPKPEHHESPAGAENYQHSEENLERIKNLAKGIFE